MAEDKPKFTRRQLDEWQRKDQQKRQRAAEDARTQSPNVAAPDGCPLWLDLSDPKR